MHDTTISFPFQNTKEIAMSEAETTTKSSKSLQMHELSSWQHYKYPINSDLLDEMCIPNASEDIVFIFRNQNDI